ncbi:solute carrier family 12 member 8-like [Dendronephthya gigantea]|uniref:solute carrier family 12 member 8-like n=1 Tax=Dendronephthya gigantea TaxID=151771 RepID=UPI0010690462|nr:solute carrier family 12 member 8-like [Dendronephthya gigantea]
MTDNNGARRRNDVDWSRFGLADNVESSKLPEQATNPNGSKDQASSQHVRELFDEEGDLQEQKPWWKANFFVTEPVLFGTWDGVFTSCMLNIFGVVIFLRTGWTVGNAGIGLSLFIVLLTLLISLVPVLSAIGIIDHIDHIEGGGIYFVLTHILGARIGATVGILYCFGQAASISLFSSGFGESLAETTSWDNHWAARTIALIAALTILGIILAGVKWVVKLQLLLLAVLVISVLDFVIGTFAHTDLANGFTGYSEENMVRNINPKFLEDESFFTVFGVFFSTATGIMAGINMSGDLKNPGENIPTGTLAALGVSGLLYMLFALLLGAVCTREALLSDYMIASKVALVGVLFLFGLYISSLSSCLGAQYAAPRIIQCIGRDNVIPLIKALGKGRGANQEPYAASIFVGLIAVVLILIGNVNSLAPVVTMPFLMTYAAVNYAYFKMVMCMDLQKRRKLIEEGVLVDDAPKSPKSEETRLVSKPEMMDGLIAKDYGTTIQNGEAIADVKMTDETEKNDLGEKENPDKDSVEYNVGTTVDNSEYNGDNAGDTTGMVVDNRGDQRSDNEGNEITDADYCELDDGEETELYKKDEKVEDKNKTDKPKSNRYPKSQFTVEIEQKRWSEYSQLANRWISLAGAFASVFMMFLIHWGYALANISAGLLIYIYIGQTNPGVTKGIAYDFNFARWVQSLWEKLTRRSPNQHRVIKMDTNIPYEIALFQVTEENPDFSNREKRHHSSLVKVISPA